MQIFYWIWIVAMAFACSVWAEEIAKLKGHNSKQWLVLGLLFGPVALIALTGYPDLEDRKHQRDSAAELSLRNIWQPNRGAVVQRLLTSEPA